MFFHHFIRYRLVFCFILYSFVCELIIYDVTFLLILLLGYIIIIISFNLAEFFASLNCLLVEF